LKVVGVLCVFVRRSTLNGAFVVNVLNFNTGFILGTRPNPRQAQMHWTN
jgi:hypothetical protein